MGGDKIVFVGAHHLLQGYRPGDKICIGNIVNFPLVMTQGFHHLISPRLLEDRVEPRYAMEISSAAIVRDIVLEGRYCSILGSRLVREDISSGRLLALSFDPGPIKRRFVTAFSCHRPQSLALKAVDAAIRAELAAL